ncbi:MAG: hypothetical protein DSY80_02215 [Desulfocapsa sp.]|nr:MAG: hypothetical protein DSY80_02215 [Desulfocapsa sp.]
MIKTTQTPVNKDEEEQALLLQSLLKTVAHFFGDWQAIFGKVFDPRKNYLIRYSLISLLCTGVLMFVFRLGSRRQIKHVLGGNKKSEEKFRALFDILKVPHGDTLNYAFKKIPVESVQEVVSWMVNRLIRNKVLDRWRFFGYFLITIDGSGRITYDERHCEHCLRKKLNNGKTLYYHPVLEAKLVTPNGFAFSMMTEFIENPEDLAKGDKQDCETKAFKRLTKRLKKRFSRLSLCLLLDGLFADGPSMKICEDNNWKYFIVLQEGDLINIHRSFEVAWGASKQNAKRVFHGKNSEIEQNYRWENKIKYTDTQQNVHYPNILECIEKKPAKQESKHLWLTNFSINFKNIDTLANGGGRLRWKAENEGFNVQKNGGYNMEHAYSHDPNASKVFYLLLQIAHIIFQLMEKGSLFRKSFPKGVGSQKNIAFRLLEAWRNLRISPDEFCRFYKGRYQIRFDTS